MDERTLQKNLANLERELVNLQTAHEIGLGVVKYYRYTGTSSAQTSFFRLDIQVDSNELAWPFLDVSIAPRGANIITQFQMLWPLDQTGRNFRVAMGGLDDYTYDWAIVSTSKISSITEVS